MTTALETDPRCVADHGVREEWRERLARLGVHDEVLSAAERESLDRDGFVILHGMSDAGWLAAARVRYEELVKREHAGMVAVTDMSTEFHRELGARRLPDLVNKGEVFDRVWMHARILAVAAHVLKRPFKLSALSARDALPGAGHQNLHADWGRRAAGEGYHVVNCIWALDGFTPENGGPRAVPGTHMLGGPETNVADLAGAHPRQVIPRVPPGSVLAMNAHTWHGGTMNRDGSARRALHAYFCAREHGQQLNQREYLRVQTAERIGGDGRWLLDA